MRRITLNIEEEKYQAFLNFIETLSYVSISEGYEIPESHKAEVNERLEVIEKGNMKTRSWEEAKKNEALVVYSNVTAEAAETDNRDAFIWYEDHEKEYV